MGAIESKQTSQKSLACSRPWGAPTAKPVDDKAKCRFHNDTLVPVRMPSLSTTRLEPSWILPPCSTPSSSASSRA
jgi:hypothetical protein